MIEFTLPKTYWTVAVTPWDGRRLGVLSVPRPPERLILQNRMLHRSYLVEDGRVLGVSRRLPGRAAARGFATVATFAGRFWVGPFVRKNPCIRRGSKGRLYFDIGTNDHKPHDDAWMNRPSEYRVAMFNGNGVVRLSSAPYGVVVTHPGGGVGTVRMPHDHGVAYSADYHPGTNLLVVGDNARTRLYRVRWDPKRIGPVDGSAELQTTYKAPASVAALFGPDGMTLTLADRRESFNMNRLDMGPTVVRVIDLE